jgi:hypothetical protein
LENATTEDRGFGDRKMKKIIVAESIMHVLDRNDKIVGQDAD